MTDTNWRQRAACRGYDPRLFDPLDGVETHALGTQAEAHPRIQTAIAVCRHCPVRLECDLASGAEEGVWAGVYRSKTKSERQATARKKAEDARFLAGTGMTPRGIAARLGVSEAYVRGLLNSSEVAA